VTAAAKTLNKSHQLVQYHARALLGQGVLRVALGGHGQGFTTYTKGDAWELFEQSLQGGKESERVLRSGQRPPPLDVHRGVRPFTVLTAPLDPVAVAGLVRTAIVKRKNAAGGVPNFWYTWVDGEARPWGFQYVAGRQRRTVIANPPHGVSRTPEETRHVEVWWQDFAEKHAHQWARLHGFELLAREGRPGPPLDLALPGSGLPKFGTAQDPVRVDDTPEPGSLEGVASVMAEVQSLGQTMPVLRDQMVRLEAARREAIAWRDQFTSEIRDLREADGGLKAVLKEHAEMFLAVAQAQSTSLPLSSRSRVLPPDFGVDVS